MLWVEHCSSGRGGGGVVLPTHPPLPHTTPKLNLEWWGAHQWVGKGEAGTGQASTSLRGRAWAGCATGLAFDQGCCKHAMKHVCAS